MRKSTFVDTNFLRFAPQQLADYLRGRFPFSTAKLAAAELGVPTRTVESWLALKASPGFARSLQMVSLWGPDFLCAVLPEPPDWASEAKARAELEALEVRSATIRSKLNKAP